MTNQEADASFEQWRAVSGYEGVYEVSDRGRVRRVKAGKGARAGHVLSPFTRSDRCLMVNLCWGGQESCRSMYIHRLVAESFIGPIPSTHTVNHKDGNRCNNRLENLEIVTWEENRKHAQETGLIPSGTRHWQAKLNPDAVRDIRARAGSTSRVTLGSEYGVSEATIRDAISGRNWKHVK